MPTPRIFINVAFTVSNRRSSLRHQKLWLSSSPKVASQATVPPLNLYQPLPSSRPLINLHPALHQTQNSIQLSHNSSTNSAPRSAHPHLGPCSRLPWIAQRTSFLTICVNPSSGRWTLSPIQAVREGTRAIMRKSRLRNRVLRICCPVQHGGHIRR